MESLYVGWQNEDTREWVPVAKLNKGPDAYTLQYTRGAKRSKSFVGLGRMGDLDKTYLSKELFPFFLNRLISKSRPEYQNYLRWLGLKSLDHNPMSMLAVTGGVRATDSLELIPSPRKEGSRLVMDFFPRSLSYLPLDVLNAIDSMVAGTRLFLMKDVQNPHDPNAFALRIDEPKALVGYFARYYCRGLGRLLQRTDSDVQVLVKQVNVDAPIAMRLLCTLSANWTALPEFLDAEDDFLPWSSDDAGTSTKLAIERALQAMKED